MSRLVVFISCLNEAETLPATLEEIPRQIPGLDEVVVVVVDDGSTDETAELARRHGADHVVRHRRNLGVARAFQTGLQTALDLGADYLVNTDGDGQYPGDRIGDLVAPLLRGEADVVLGDRGPGKVAHFSPVKRWLQRLGSHVVSRFAGTPIPDAASGFRAFTREAALRLKVFTEFSYSQETLIQAGHQGLALAFIPVTTRRTDRPSRLHKGNLHYVFRQLLTIGRALAYYAPIRTFGCLALPFFLGGFVLELRFAVLYLTGQGGIGRYIHSVTLGGFLLTIGCLIAALGLIGDGLQANRRLAQDALLRLERLERGQSTDAGDPARRRGEG
ncbi:MAG: glycosyltransferase family 2 protein [Acidobacteriota bacterium]